jgi:hypothetical protein
MPKYSYLPIKVKAREEVANFYKKITGENTVQNEYWTLCNEQPDFEFSEINQMLDLGIIKNKSQFHGVDLSKEIIDMNKSLHPEAHWYHGDWLDVIRDHDFNPSFIYLDGTNLPKNMLSLTATTLRLSPKNCVLFVNFPLNNPHNKDHQYDFDFNLELNKSIILDNWSCEGRLNYNATGKSNMQTYVYKKGF